MSYYLLLKNSGDPAGALQHLEKHMELQNRINDDQSRKTVMDMLAAYEWEKQEKEIRLLEQSDQLKTSRMRLQWLLVGLLVLMGLLILVVGWSVIRHKNQKLKEMKTGLQHFLLHEKKSGSPALYFNNIPHEAIAEKWGLTARESEILYLLGQGCSNAKIAAQLFISANTVKFHIKNIYIKLNVKSRMEAVLRCSEHDPSGTLSH